MEREKVDKIINISVKVLFSALFVVMFFAVMRIEATKKPQEEIDAILEQQKEDLDRLLAGKSLNENLPETWPAKMNKPYPEIELIDKDGKSFKLSDLKGKVVILSFLDMSSPTSQAQSGAGLSGTYGLTQDKDPLAETFDDALRKVGDGNLTLPHPDILQVNVLVYKQDGGQPTVDEAANWATHFDLEREKGVIVAVPQKDIRGEESEKIINGFQLLDKNHILRVDSSGPEPKHNLKMTLIPLVPKLLR